MAAAAVCPVVGTTNTILPPAHPDVDLDKAGQVCPITNATTDHHHNLAKHPPVPGAMEGGAQACPALKDIVNEPQNKAIEENVCPIVGPATTVLPPDHPSTTNAKEGDVCPVTKATIGHHKDKVHQHPSVESAPKDAVCPVAGVKAQ